MKLSKLTGKSIYHNGEYSNYFNFNTIAVLLQKLESVYGKRVLSIEQMSPQEVKSWAKEMTFILNKTGYLLDTSKPYLELILGRINLNPDKVIFSKKNDLVSAILAIKNPMGGQIRVEISGFNGDIASSHLQLLRQLRVHLKKSITHFEHLDANYYMWLNKMNYILDYSN